MTLRLPKAELPAELEENMIEQLGAVPENVEVLWHSPRVAQDNLELGLKVGAWKAVEPGLKSFAHMAVASQVGCSWCPDVGYFQAQNENLDLAKASQVTVCLNAAPAIRIASDAAEATVSLVIEDGRVTRIYATSNPHKLTRLDEPVDLMR